MFNLLLELNPGDSVRIRCPYTLKGLVINIEELDLPFDDVPSSDYQPKAKDE